jgi:hypothetical protein
VHGTAGRIGVIDAHFSDSCPYGVIARLDPKSGLPDFGTLNDRNRKLPISIGNPVPPVGGYWIARSSRAMTLN